MKEVTRILIADDHPIFRDGLVRTIERTPGYVIVAQVGNGADALKSITELHPDLALLDVSMPEMDGLEVARRVHKLAILTEIVILTMYSDERYFHTALDLGVRGYIVKDSVASELLACIEAVNAGRYYTSPVFSSLLVERNDGRVTSAGALPPFNQLTPAERTILKLVSENKTSKEIGQALFVSTRTVENHRTHICQKLGVKGHNALLQFALENKFKF